MPYATKEEVEAWVGHEVPDVARKIRDAELLLSEFLTVPITDPAVFTTEETDALRDAVSAQIEFWETVNPDHETAGVRATRIRMDQDETDLPGRLARRSRSILLQAGLGYQGVVGFVRELR